MAPLHPKSGSREKECQYAYNFLLLFRPWMLHLKWGLIPQLIQQPCPVCASTVILESFKLTINITITSGNEWMWSSEEMFNSQYIWLSLGKWSWCGQHSDSKSSAEWMCSSTEMKFYSKCFAQNLVNIFSMTSLTSHKIWPHISNLISY